MRQYSLKEVRNILAADFKGYEQLQKELKNNVLKYGKDEKEVFELTNKILRETSKNIICFKNYLGGSLKIGVSSPSYADASKNFPASFDGRNKGIPFQVHISCENSNGYTELVQFAAGLDYKENRLNGNVVDFMVSPSFINHNFEKFKDFLLLSIEAGFFQLQMNVVNSDTLIKAKNNPELFPNLIVRVWGFSAYFVELPENYQKILIQRTLENER